jgi:anti-sigma-K factor RskA
MKKALHPFKDSMVKKSAVVALPLTKLVLWRSVLLVVAVVATAAVAMAAVVVDQDVVAVVMIVADLVVTIKK